MNFKLECNIFPSGDQPQAIEKIVNNFLSGKREQVLLGATGTGKTFTMANIVQKLQTSALVICHNKTLAMQLYSEMKRFFPFNKVEYYVSFFDYYRPEAYNVTSDIFLEKKTQRNENIEKMRMDALNSLTNEKFVIIVASVASIYGCLSPLRYREATINLSLKKTLKLQDFLEELGSIGYSNDKGNIIVNEDRENPSKISIDIEREDDSFLTIFFNKRGKELIIKGLRKSWRESGKVENLQEAVIPPVQYVIEKDEIMNQIITQIKADLEAQKINLISGGKTAEAERLETRVNEDIKDLKEFGFCNGVENYSLYFDGRKTGESPFVLLDFFDRNNFLTIIDESHITVPQIKGMYTTDQNRKQTLVNYGFRLPSALDNRPLNFQEFENKLDKVLYVSATPGDFELERVNQQITEQIIRPTGLLDPQIEIRSSDNQIEDIIDEIKKRRKTGGKVLVYVLSINMSEKLSEYLSEKGIKCVCVHGRLNVFERYQAISSLRRGVYEVIVGINILKEGIDIPEVSLVCIIDADKTGFLRNVRSLIQIIGRSARNSDGKVIFYSEKITNDMKIAIEKTKERRQIQIKHNFDNKITPRTIEKDLTDVLIDPQVAELNNRFRSSSTTQKEKVKIVAKIERIMKAAVKEFRFDKAIGIRDVLLELKRLLGIEHQNS